MKQLIISLVIAATMTGFVQTVDDDDFYTSKDDFINDIIDKHLKKKVEPNEVFYRQELAQDIFESLIFKYPKRSFFVNVYAPVMGFDNHAMRAFDMYDRLHKRNDMRFNVFVASVIRKDFPDL